MGNGSGFTGGVSPRWPLCCAVHVRVRVRTPFTLCPRACARSGALRHLSPNRLELTLRVMARLSHVPVLLVTCRPGVMESILERTGFYLPQRTSSKASLWTMRRRPSISRRSSGRPAERSAAKRPAAFMFGKRDRGITNSLPTKRRRRVAPACCAPWSNLRPVYQASSWRVVDQPASTAPGMSVASALAFSFKCL